MQVVNFYLNRRLAVEPVLGQRRNPKPVPALTPATHINRCNNLPIFTWVPTAHHIEESPKEVDLNDDKVIY